MLVPEIGDESKNDIVATQPDAVLTNIIEAVTIIILLRNAE